MSDQSVDILVVGDGVSAKALLFELECKNTGLSVLQVSSNKLYPRTSLASTAIVARHGVRKGVSALGDILTDGVDNFFKNVYSTGLMGMEKGLFYDLAPESDIEVIKSRYGGAQKIEAEALAYGEGSKDLVFAKEECIFINPPVFMSSLDEQFNVPIISKTLIAVEDKTAIFLGGDKIHFDKIILCAGVGLTLLDGLGIHIQKNIKEVPGAYLKWELDLPTECFAYGLETSNLVYRKADNCLMLGGSTQQNNIITPDLEALEFFYNRALEYGLDWLPKFSDSEIIKGTRVKGVKRMPLFNEVRDDIFVLGAAYKNGWSQAFLGAKKIGEILF
jgi:hypothetical protein